MKPAVPLLLLCAIGLGACAAPPPSSEPAAFTAPRQVYVVRHLQKAAGDDPPLTADGAANAQKLADMLEGKRIAAIFATRTRRAMETAQPLASRLGLAVTPYEPRDFASLAAAVANAPGPVLIVGHSNTVPDIVDRLGAPPQPPMDESDYGTLFVIAGDGSVTRLELR